MPESHEVYLHRMFTFCLCQATTSFKSPQQLTKQNLPAKRKQGKAALPPSQRKLKVWGGGRKGKSRSLAP